MSPLRLHVRRILVIPARRRSTRLPDKMLLRAAGKTVLQHTYEAALKVKRAELILIATDDEEIAAECRRFGAQAVMTSPNCPSGTDRVAEAVSDFAAAEVIVNLQGDEPEADAAAIDRLFELLEATPTAAMATLATPIRDRHKLEDPSCVKVTFDAVGRAHRPDGDAAPAVRRLRQGDPQSNPDRGDGVHRTDPGRRA